MPKYLKEGDIIVLGPKHSVYTDVPEHFAYSNRRGSWELTHTNVSLDDEFSYLQGEYIVYKTTMDGGGTGHGPHDVYPDGHHVFCEKADDSEVKVDFYQSGAFTAMITDIKPVGKAKRKWTKQ